MKQKIHTNGKGKDPHSKASPTHRHAVIFCSAWGGETSTIGRFEGYRCAKKRFTIPNHIDVSAHYFHTVLSALAGGPARCIFVRFWQINPSSDKPKNDSADFECSKKTGLFTKISQTPKKVGIQWRLVIFWIPPLEREFLFSRCALPPPPPEEPKNPEREAMLQAPRPRCCIPPVAVVCGRFRGLAWAFLRLFLF